MMKLAMKKRQKGVTMIEYGLIAALISVVAVLALGTIGTDVNQAFQSIANALPTAQTTGN